MDKVGYTDIYSKQMYTLLKFSVLANHVIDHVIVGILLVVYSGVDHINTTRLSPQSCHSTYTCKQTLYLKNSTTDLER